MSSSGIEPLSFQELAGFAKPFELIDQFPFDLLAGCSDTLFRQDEVLRRINVDFVDPFEFFTRHGVDHRQLFNFIAPQLDTVGEFLIRWPDFDDIAAHAKVGA